MEKKVSRFQGTCSSRIGLLVINEAIAEIRRVDDSLHFADYESVVEWNLLL